MSYLYFEWSQARVSYLMVVFGRVLGRMDRIRNVPHNTWVTPLASVYKVMYHYTRPSVGLWLPVTGQLQTAHHHRSIGFGALRHTPSPLGSRSCWSCKLASSRLRTLCSNPTCVVPPGQDRHSVSPMNATMGDDSWDLDPSWSSHGRRMGQALVPIQTMRASLCVHVRVGLRTSPAGSVSKLVHVGFRVEVHIDAHGDVRIELHTNRQRMLETFSTGVHAHALNVRTRSMEH